jgi:hypothetical protein
MAKRVKKEGAPDTPRAPRRRAPADAYRAPATVRTKASSEAMPELAGGGSAGPLATASPEALAADDLAREPATHDIVREPAEERPARDQIARRAYELYEQRGGVPGRDLDDWLAAEAELARGRAK